MLLVQRVKRFWQTLRKNRGLILDGGLVYSGAGKGGVQEWKAANKTTP
jgi:hypothetical protein